MVAMPSADPASEFRALAELEPRLSELEARVRAVVDDGRASFFCSNHVWLPIQGDLKRLVGVERRGAAGEAKGGPLWDSRSFEVAYRHLSGLLPKCRACGCRVFEPYRVATR
jgi:hypothetical protein